MANRDLALQHLEAAAAALTAPDALTQAQAVQRHAELGEEKPGFWAHIEQITGGYSAIASPSLMMPYDALPTPLGPHVPEGSNRRYACADFEEVVAVLHGRFGD
jgi:hypothetical protein